MEIKEIDTGLILEVELSEDPDFGGYGVDSLDDLDVAAIGEIFVDIQKHIAEQGVNDDN